MHGVYHARREYETLTGLWDAFSRYAGRFTVPQPLGFFPEWGALLLEHCSGVRLVDELGWARVRAISPWKKRLLQQAQASGEWLGVFHQITARDEDSQTVARLIEEEFQRDLDRCAQRGLDRALASRLAQAFATCREMLKGRPQLLVNQHGDFGPHNVFFSGHTVTVIDFEGLRPGFRYSDLSYFLAVVESRSVLHAGPAGLHEITEHFLDGYARHHPVDRNLLRAFMVPAMVKLMAYNPLLARSPRNPLERWRQAAQRQRYVVWLRSHV
jgi:Ser/Thr protein kinase RdoA (MazF antagonist)